MTAVAPVETPADTGWSGPDDFDHLWCECRGEWIALCGRDLRDCDNGPIREDHLCVVCADLEFQPCDCDGRSP